MQARVILFLIVLLSGFGLPPRSIQAEDSELYFANYSVGDLLESPAESHCGFCSQERNQVDFTPIVNLISEFVLTEARHVDSTENVSFQTIMEYYPTRSLVVRSDATGHAKLVRFLNGLRKLKTFGGEAGKEEKPSVAKRKFEAGDVIVVRARIESPALDFPIACRVVSIAESGLLTVEGNSIVNGINKSVRYLGGTVRPEDVDSENTVDSRHVANLVIKEDPSGSISARSLGGPFFGFFGKKADH